MHYRGDPDQSLSPATRKLTRFRISDLWPIEDDTSERSVTGAAARVRRSHVPQPNQAPRRRGSEALAAIVADASYPCVGAKSVFARGRFELLVLDALADTDATSRLRQALADFSAAHPRETGDAPPAMASFIAAFRTPVPTSEVEFEDLLWRQLAMLHAADDAPWDETVSSNPDNPHFGFSVAGRAFFVIGMHPAASRQARRAPLPVLVFNLHSQFEQLRASGHYDRIRDTVRKRDVRLQGCPNPMVADHGVRSEARQYSGRVVGDDWRPPHYIEEPQP